MEAMRQRSRSSLQGDVRIDDAYRVGSTGRQGWRGLKTRWHCGRRGTARWTSQRVRFDPVAGFSFAALTPLGWRRHWTPEAVILSDGLGFEVLRKLGYDHRVVIPKGQGRHRNRAVQVAERDTGQPENIADRHLSRLKFRKYAARYLADVQYRFNRRSDSPRCCLDWPWPS